MTGQSAIRLSSCSIVLLVTAVLGTTALLSAPDDLYPNELAGFQFVGTARWNVLRPFISTQADAFALLGPPQSYFYDMGDDWKLVITYVGEGSCDGKPWPDFLAGRISTIQLIPKRRVSLSGVRFPSAFKKSEPYITHHVVDTLRVYSDAYGLEYELYAEGSKDGSIHEGDLKAINYGPSRKLYSSMTGCDP
jgi:hypothetical protein